MQGCSLLQTMFALKRKDRVTRSIKGQMYARASFDAPRLSV